MPGLCRRCERSLCHRTFRSSSGCTVTAEEPPCLRLVDTLSLSPFCHIDADLKIICGQWTDIELAFCRMHLKRKRAGCSVQREYWHICKPPQISSKAHLSLRGHVDKPWSWTLWGKPQINTVWNMFRQLKICQRGQLLYNRSIWMSIQRYAKSFPGE